MRGRIMTIGKQIDMHQVEQLDRETLLELRDQGHECLSGTVQLALAADQRAITLAGLFGAVAVGVATVIVTLPGSERPPSVTGAGICLVVLFFASSMLAALASRSVDFHVSGYEPARRLHAAESIEFLLRDSVIDLQRRIDFNREGLILPSQRVNRSINVALSALPLSAAIFAIFEVWDRCLS
jgi:hypothetical protein